MQVTLPGFRLCETCRDLEAAGLPEGWPGPEHRQTRTRGLDLKGEECVKGHRTGVPAGRGGEAFLGDPEAAPAPGHPHPLPGRPEASQPGPQLLSGP